MKHLFAIFVLLFSSHVVAGVAPMWQLPDLNDGEMLSLDQLRGHVVVLDFWASWCVPCRPAMHALSQLQQDYADAPVRIVAISVDEDAHDAQSFIARYGPMLKSLHDPQGAVAEAYGLLGMPSSFVIGPDGQLVLRHQGFRKGDEAVWREAINEQLAIMNKPAAI